LYGVCFFFFFFFLRCTPVWTPSIPHHRSLGARDLTTGAWQGARSKEAGVGVASCVLCQSAVRCFFRGRCVQAD
jgi:hypothetical protein